MSKTSRLPVSRQTSTRLSSSAEISPPDSGSMPRLRHIASAPAWAAASAGTSAPTNSAATENSGRSECTRVV